MNIIENMFELSIIIWLDTAAYWHRPLIALKICRDAWLSLGNKLKIRGEVLYIKSLMQNWSIIECWGVPKFRTLPKPLIVMLCFLTSYLWHAKIIRKSALWFTKFVSHVQIQMPSIFVCSIIWDVEFWPDNRICTFFKVKWRTSFP